MIYLLTAIGLTTVGSSQSTHLHKNRTQNNTRQNTQKVTYLKIIIKITIRIHKNT
jgi:hypothetical protein